VEIATVVATVDVQSMVVGTRVSVETGAIVACLPSENIRDLTLETGVSEGLREPPAGSPDGGRPEGGT
jgi:hypothetical protein